MTDRLTALARVIEERSGLSLSERQLPSLAGALRRVSADGDAAAVLDRMTDEREGDRLLERLIDEVTVNETFFLRERDQLAPLDWNELLEAARRRGEHRIRVWSAACATGEEPYTLALLAGEALGWPDPPVEILGTDISTTALTLGARARYSKRSVRQLDATLLEAHFQQQSGAYSPNPYVQRLVRFAPHNLARAPLPPDERGFDLVVCRNVLIYFGQEAVAHALALLGQALASEGHLILGSADRLAIPARAAPRKLAQRAERRAPRPGRQPSEPRPADRMPRFGRPRPRRPEATQAAQPSVGTVLELADAGRMQESVDVARQILAEEPTNPDALFVLGMVELATGRAAEAVASLRAALYLRPCFALAAFMLGRAHDTLGDAGTARRAYEQALRTFDPDDEWQQAWLHQIDLADLAQACRARLTTTTRPAIRA